MKQIKNYLFTLFILFVLTSCSNDDGGTDTPTPPGSSSEFDENQPEIEEGIFYIFNSFAANLSGDRYDIFRKYDNVLNVDEIMPVGDAYYMIYEDFGQPFINENQDILYLPPGNYTYQASTDSFQREENSTGEVIINYPREGSATNNAQIIFSDAHKTIALYAFSSGFVSSFLTDGTVTFFLNGIEEYRFETSQTYYTEIDNDDVPFDIITAHQKIFVQGQPFMEFKLGIDGYDLQQIIYDEDNTNEPTIFKVNLAGEFAEFETFLFGTVSLFTQFGVISVIAEPFVVDVLEINSIDGMEFIKGEDKMVIDVDYTRVLTQDELNEYINLNSDAAKLERLKNYKLKDFIVGGYMEQNGEVLFDMVRDGDELKAEYRVFGGIQLSAEEYLETNFNPLEIDFEQNTEVILIDNDGLLLN